MQWQRNQAIVRGADVLITGTFYVSCLIKQAPEAVDAVCLIDPVCCCMWSGHLINNFVYNPAK